MLRDYKERPVTPQAGLLHRLFEGFELGEVAVFVVADEEEPLVDVEGAPGGVREAEGAAVGALQAWAQGVEGGARLAEARERVGERDGARRAGALGRFVLDAVAALDELPDGDGVEGSGVARADCARLLGLVEQLAEQLADVALDYRDVLDKLRRRPAVGRGAVGLLLLAQTLDGREQARARAVDVFEDFGDAAEVHKGWSLLFSSVGRSRPSTAACGETCSTCQRWYLTTGSFW